MKELRFGVIGWGYWGPKIARNLDSVPHATVTIVADTNKRLIESLPLDQSRMKITTQAEDVFHSNVDGIAIATPTMTHYELAKKALLSGKHVLVEKPLTTSVAQAQEHLAYADGMTAHIHVSWLHPCKIRRVTIIGDERMAVYDDTNPAEMIKIYNKGADVHADPVVSYRFGEITIPHIDWIEPLRLECEDFANSIRTGMQPRASGKAGLAVVEVLAAAQEALLTQEKQKTRAGSV